MAQPTAGDVHVDVPLSNIATAYKNMDYIADLIAKRVPVNKQSDKYYTWTKDFWFRNQVEKRTPGDSYPEAGIELSTDSYFADIYHLAYPIPDEVAGNQDAAVQLEITGAEWLADQFALNREIKLAASIFAASIWGTDKTGGTDFVVWSDYANSTPIEDVDDGLTAIQGNTGREPNILVVGRQVFDKLKRHPNLIDLYKHTNVGILTPEQVRAALNVQTLLIGNAIRTTSLESASSITYSRIWAKHALLMFVPETPGLRVPAATYAFEWDIDGGGLSVPITRVREDLRDRELLRGKHAFDDKIVGTDLGYFFSGAVA